jgi:hypothetical protein
LRFTGPVLRVQHHGNGPRLHVFVGLLGTDEVAPAGAAENVLAEGELALEIVLLHDPGSPEAAAVQAVLDVVLLQQDFFEDLRKGVAARIGAVLLDLGHGVGVGIDEVADAGVAADQDDLPECRTGAAGLEQPEQALDGHVHDRLRALLAGGQVQHMGDPGHRLVHDCPMLDGAPHHFQSFPSR